MAVFILDTSAVLTLLNREDGLDAFLTLLDKAKDGQATLFLPFMVLMELEYLLLRKMSAEETLAILMLVSAWPVQIQESTEEWRYQSAQIKARSPLSVADSWVASLAIIYQAELVHKDPEFEQVPGLAMVKLPYRSR